MSDINRRATQGEVAVYDEALWMVAGNNMTPDAWTLTPAR